MLIGFVLLLAFQSSSVLEGQFGQIARKSGGRIGAAVLLIETGETHGLRADERFPMQSVLKLPIGMTVLRDVDHGKLSLDQK